MCKRMSLIVNVVKQHGNMTAKALQGQQSTAVAVSTAVEDVRVLQSAVVCLCELS